ncbi:hypothetical protein EIP86_002694 [Pleurotus ostreatoroseus]|nr:hypothetical protein EIP86_002694 [Pleurotus ostreatoroseus]
MSPPGGGSQPAGYGFGFPSGGAPPPIVDDDDDDFDSELPSSETFKGICTEFSMSDTPFPSGQSLPPTSRPARSDVYGSPGAGRRLHMAVESDSLWPVGAIITVGFMSGRWAGTPKLRQKVEEYARQWMQYANIKFIFVQGSDADVRVAFNTKDGGSWSFVGRACLSRPKNEQTVNFGWFNDNTPEDEFSRTILHEFGHVLGCIHEHSMPLSPFQWNRRLVIAYYEQQQLQGWLKKKFTVAEARQKVREWVENNIFQKYSRQQTQFTRFDPESIMLYPFQAWMTTNNQSSGWNRVLSVVDKSFIAALYPYNARPPTPPPPPPPPRPSPPTQPHVRSFTTALIARRGQQNEQLSGLYQPAFGSQTGSGNPTQLPCLGVTSLELASPINEVLVRSQALLFGSGQYRVKADCWRTYATVECVQFSWLDLPQGYPDVQFGTYNQTVNIRDATVAAQENSYRVSFQTPFSSQPKVAVFLGQFYVDQARNYRFMISAESIDRWGFTLKIQSSGQNPDVMTNFVVNWIAHPADSPWVESGTFTKVFTNESRGSGTIRFAHDDWPRTPAVCMGLSLLELRGQDDIKIQLTAQRINSRSMAWYFGLGSICPFGVATGQYIVFA